MAKQSILDVLGNATEDDLSEIINRRKVLQREDEALAVMEKAIAFKLHGKPARAKPGTKTPKASSNGRADNEEQLRIKAAHELLRNGPMKQALLLHNIGLQEQAGRAPLFNHEWFDRTPDGIALSSAGKRANG